jgi:hypothetical protein
MTISPSDYEKLGTFYLGREYDISTKTTEEKLVLYDSKDLVTHGVVLGMTGSGKTGLCFALLEEAAMDNIPAIIIDPKGDLSNFLLTFPELTGEAFRPWINEEDAAKKQKTPDEFAAGQAAMWEKGLGEWGQSAARIKTLRETVDINIFTPGSNAGIPVSILASLGAPDFEIIDDNELFAERIETTASSILGLIGITADPINSRDHILLSNIFNHSWRAGENLDLEKIINYVQTPPFAKVGALDLEAFYPEKKRSELAMGINNLLASPGFSTWLTGEALDIKRMLHTPEGKPRVSIFSIAHLNDSERMFFVSLLLNQMVGWMRSQSGTTSLRALLYMDEIYGYLPPTANPPSKKPLMILLKQSRAFGLGLLVATQNPVDLDYKALSNIGTWFLGRLQTERDKARVLDGLEGAASSQGSKFDRSSMEKMLSSLGNRIFLMNNVHEDSPCVFQVRWCMSYLRGPLTRTQIKKLMDPKRAAFTGTPAAAPVSNPAPAASPPSTINQPPSTPATSPASGRPALPASVNEYFYPVTSPSAQAMPMVYLPAILRSAEMTFSDAPKDVFVMRRLSLISKLSEDMITLDAANAIRSRLDASALSREPVPGPVTYAAVPPFALKASTYTAARDQAVDWLFANETIDLSYCEKYNIYSKPGEPEVDFRLRLQHRAKEERDRELEDLRQKYHGDYQKLEAAAAKAQVTRDREAAQARSAKITTVVNIGQTILGALFGRKALSRTTISKSSTAARSATRAFEQHGDVTRAEAKLEDIQAEMAALKNRMDNAMETIRLAADPDHLQFTKAPIRALKKNIAINAFGLAWLPYYQTGTGSLEPAWDES